MTTEQRCLNSANMQVISVPVWPGVGVLVWPELGVFCLCCLPFAQGALPSHADVVVSFFHVPREYSSMVPGPHRDPKLRPYGDPLEVGVLVTAGHRDPNLRQHRDPNPRPYRDPSMPYRNARCVAGEYSLAFYMGSATNFLLVLPAQPIMHGEYSLGE